MGFGMSAKRLIAGLIGKAILWVLAGGSAFAALVAVAWTLYVPAILAVLTFFVLAPVYQRGRFRLQVRSALGAAILGVSVFAVPEYMNSATDTMARWGAIVRDRGGAGLTLRDRVAIYLGNIGMAGGGLMLGFQEAAIETFLLGFANPDHRYWDSDFAWGTKLVQNYVHEFAHNLAYRRSIATTFTADLVWPNYAAGGFRVPLALNGGKFEIKARKEAAGWTLFCDAIARVEYFKRYRASTIGVIGSGRLVVDQGAWEGLQQIGWFDPYSAHWRFSVRTDPKGRIISVFSGWH